MTSASTTLPTGSLSERLRAETRQAHERAEHSTFMEDLLGGKLDAAAFIALQEQALLFYGALEDALEACAGDAASTPSPTGSSTAGPHWPMICRPWVAP